MKRIIGAILFVIYSAIAILVTVLLLSFNDYNCSEIGGYTVYIVRDDALEPEYEQGSVLLVKSTNDKHVKAGDEVFFYKVINTQEYEFVSRTLTYKDQRGTRILYGAGDNEEYDSNFFVGKAEDTIVLDAPWGTLLSILESKWGYLFCIVIVSLLLFLQEVFDLIIEIKYGGTKGTKAANVANARKAAAKGATTRKVATGTTTKTPAKTATKSTTTTRTATTTKTATVAKKVPAAVEANNAETGAKEEG